MQSFVTFFRKLPPSNLIHCDTVKIGDKACGAFQYFASYKEVALGCCHNCPFYKGNRTIKNFDCSDTSGMNATTVIKIEMLPYSRKYRTMGMATDNHLIILIGPVNDAFFQLVF